MSTTNWEERGQAAVGAAANLATGLFKGFRSLGGRIQAGRHLPVIEAFCACSGMVAAQNGKLKREEIEGFRRFLLNNRQHPVLGRFPSDEMVSKFRDYAVKAFLDEEEVFTRVLDQVTRGSDEAYLIVAGCLAVVFADGHCDPMERNGIEHLAGTLGIDTATVARSMGVTLPPPTAGETPRAVAISQQQPLAPSIAPPPAPPSMTAPMAAPPPPAPTSVPSRPSVPPAAPSAQPAGKPCSFCSGKGCAFCNNTGIATA